jgi:hypothetical protein
MEDHQPSMGRFNFSGVIPSNILASLAISIVCPYIFYQFLMQHSVAVLLSLSIAAVFPFVVIILFLLRQRALDLVALLSLLWIAFLVVCSFITPYLADVRLISLVRVVPVGLIGIAFLLTQFSSYPLLFYVDRYLSTNNQPEQMAIYQQDWQSSMRYQRMIKMLNAIWGVGLLVDLLLVALFLFVVVQSSLVISLVIIIVPALLLVSSVQYKSTVEKKEQEQRVQRIDEE